MSSARCGSEKYDTGTSKNHAKALTVATVGFTFTPRRSSLRWDSESLNPAARHRATTSLLRQPRNGVASA